ncbi:MAG: DEAD/DEAH box helicase, partial [Methanoregulaceae archaeon]|nr:DEAD/DEAH box helicase [Methanoregulaceae archaeon]
MNVIVHPHREQYKLFFFEERSLSGIGIVDMSETPKGPRPAHYRVRWGARKQYRNTPTRDLVNLIRKLSVQLTRPDPPFETFLKDFQVPFTYINVCRVCLLEERVTELDEKTAVRYGTRGDRVCMDCA